MKRLLPFLLSLNLCAGGIPKDKLAHFGAGMAIGAVVTVSFRWSGGRPLQSARIGFVVGTGMGVIKEGVDQYTYEQAKRLRSAYSYSPQTNAYAQQGVGAFGKGADAGDAIATAAGAALGSYIVYRFYK